MNKQANKIKIHIRKIKEEYILSCGFKFDFVFGFQSAIEPSLTGFIKYWRRYENNPNYVVEYYKLLPFEKTPTPGYLLK